MQWRGVVISSTLNHGKIAVNLRQISEPSNEIYFPSDSPNSDVPLPVDVAASPLNFVSCQTAKAGAARNTPAKAPTSTSHDSGSTKRGISWSCTLQSFLAAHITMNKQYIKVVYHWRLRSMTALMRRTAQITPRYKHISAIERLKTK